MKAEFSDLEGDYHKEVSDISASDVDRLLAEAREKGGAGSVSLAISRTEKDYINIDYVGKGQFLFQTDRLEKVGTLWQRLFQYPRIVKTITGHEIAKEFVSAYINKSRYAFEEYCR